MYLPPALLPLLVARLEQETTLVGDTEVPLMTVLLHHVFSVNRQAVFVVDDEGTVTAVPPEALSPDEHAEVARRSDEFAALVRRANGGTRPRVH